jgi:putative FmdB family regulatory protein
VPIYEYVCEACGRLTEVMQRMSDPPPAACPACGGPKLSKVVSRTSFQLKGGGWYSDLYASPREKKSGDAGGSGAASSGSAAPAAPSPSGPAPSSAPAPGGGGTSSGGGAAGGSSGGGKPSGGAT